MVDAGRRIRFGAQSSAYGARPRAYCRIVGRAEFWARNDICRGGWTRLGNGSLCRVQASSRSAHCREIDASSKLTGRTRRLGQAIARGHLRAGGRRLSLRPCGLLAFGRCRHEPYHRNEHGAYRGHHCPKRCDLRGERKAFHRSTREATSKDISTRLNEKRRSRRTQLPLTSFAHASTCGNAP